MTKAINDSKSQSTNQIRNNFCEQLATKIRSGTDRFLIRFTRRDATPIECWIYARQNHQWQKCDDLSIDSNVVSPLLEDMESVSHRDVSDAWSCRRVDHQEHVDFELQFRPMKLESHQDGDLESFLLGTLFCGHHDTGKDSRRRIQFRNPR